MQTTETKGQTQHTPGPWKVFICDDGGQWSGWPLSIGVVGDPDKSIVRPGGQWPYEWDAATSKREAVANARLIASAPELLEALKELSSFCNLPPGRTRNAMFAKAAAAIAKAEGR